MNQRATGAPPVQGRCDGCGVLYRWKDASREATCRGCGGTVRAVTGDGSVTCSACRAVNRHGATFCAECDEPLGVAPLRMADHEEIEARRAVTRELRAAYRKVDVIAWLFRAGAAAYGLVTVAAVVALRDTNVPREAGMLVVGLAAALTVTMLLGALRLAFRPTLWTVAAAVLATLVTVAHAVGPNPLDLALFFSAAWALVFWGAVPSARRMGRLIDEHIDLYIEHHASQATKRSLRGRTPKQRHARLVAAMNRASSRTARAAFAASAAILAVATAGAWFVDAELRPEPLEGVVARFSTAWEREGPRGVAAWLPAERRASEEARLGNVLAGHGVVGKPAPLGGLTISGHPAETWVEAEVDGVPLRSRWVLDGARWSLRELVVPIPPFEPVRAGFLETWAAGNAAAIADHYPEEHRASRHASIADLAERRGWAPLPAYEKVEDGPGTLEMKSFDLWLPEGTVSTGWRFGGDGRWVLHRFDYFHGTRKRDRAERIEELRAARAEEEASSVAVAGSGGG